MVWTKNTGHLARGRNHYYNNFSSTGGGFRGFNFTTVFYKIVCQDCFATSLPSFSKQLLYFPSSRLLHLPLCLPGLFFPHSPARLIHLHGSFTQFSSLPGCHLSRVGSFELSSSSILFSHNSFYPALFVFIVLSTLDITVFSLLCLFNYFFSFPH